MKSNQCNAINYGVKKDDNGVERTQCIFRKCVVDGHIPEPTYGNDPDFQGYCLSLPVPSTGKLKAY